MDNEGYVPMTRGALTKRSYGYYQQDSTNTPPFPTPPGHYYFKIDDDSWDCYSDGKTLVVRQDGAIVHTFPLIMGPLALVHLGI